MKTKRIRIAVAIDANGKGRAVWYHNMDDAWNMAAAFSGYMNRTGFIVEADIPIPEPVESQVVEGEVVDENV